MFFTLNVNIDLSYSAVHAGESLDSDVSRDQVGSLKQKLSTVQHQLASARRKVKLLLLTKRRLAKRNANLVNVISELEKQKVYLFLRNQHAVHMI